MTGGLERAASACVLVTGLGVAAIAAQTPALKPEDYIAIQQLVSKYAFAIDECTNRGGATGKVYLIAIGLDGEPGKVEAQGRYDDVYVKTPQGWRFKTRTHMLSATQQEVSSGAAPPKAGR